MQGAGICFQGSWPLATAKLIGLLLWGGEESVAKTERLLAVVTMLFVRFLEGFAAGL